MLEVNQTAPGFSAVNQDGATVTLDQFHGKNNVVLYFYPKDDTPGCTIEANEFSALIDEFAAADTVSALTVPSLNTLSSVSRTSGSIMCSAAARSNPDFS